MVIIPLKRAANNTVKKHAENTNSLNLLHSGAKLEQFSKHVNISFMQCRPVSRIKDNNLGGRSE